MITSQIPQVNRFVAPPPSFTPDTCQPPAPPDLNACAADLGGIGVYKPKFPDPYAHQTPHGPSQPHRSLQLADVYACSARLWTLPAAYSAFAADVAYARYTNYVWDGSLKAESKFWAPKHFPCAPPEH